MWTWQSKNPSGYRKVAQDEDDEDAGTIRTMSLVRTRRNSF